MMLQPKAQYHVAIVGATGAVGGELLEILEERKFPLGELRLLASERSAGETLSFEDRSLPVQVATPGSFEGVDIALFSAGEAISQELAPAAVRAGAVVIDNSSAFRMEPKVPLVVPEVNGHALAGHHGIIANPNCSTAQLVMVLKPLHDAARLRRVVVATYQSVSGTGKEAMDELMEQTRALLSFREPECRVYRDQIAFNCIINWECDEDGYTTEERKLIRETRKILGEPGLNITATTVRVPVFRGHGEAAFVELERPLSANEARAILSAAPGVLVFDNPDRGLYPMQVEAAGHDEVYVGRIRRDESVPAGLNLWIVADNLRKGAALNAVQIAEALIHAAQKPGREK